MRDLEFTLQRWAAWAPGLETQSDWQVWAQNNEPLNDDGSSPKLAFIEPMLRRRFSRLTRMALQAAYQCLSGDDDPNGELRDFGDKHHLRTIFCSRHGEIHRTKALLDDIVRGEPISPMGFSLSVHNTASGLYAIATGNTAPSSAIAAGVDTLEMAMVDAFGHLHRQPGQAVLVVLADEPLPAFYQPYDDEQAAPYGLALLLASAGAGQVVRLKTITNLISGNEPHGLSILRWLYGREATCRVAGERLNWQWSRSHD